MIPKPIEDKLATGNYTLEIYYDEDYAGTKRWTANLYEINNFGTYNIHEAHGDTLKEALDGLLIERPTEDS